MPRPRTGALQDRDPVGDRLLTPGEVARIFGVDPKTVNQWALTGKIPSIRTPSNHRRYREIDIKALINASTS
ncbi:BldC family transcriptional regulator [Streptosporangium saharense]|uniref:BldC family transcriptional regulator n=1 Tax=Streptosporangium saharense TaxID=1706840 RepID=UPI00161FFD50|nr:BldC family transcriptional regulator [Streptosporangium saharense]